MRSRWLLALLCSACGTQGLEVLASDGRGGDAGVDAGNVIVDAGVPDPPYDAGPQVETRTSTISAGDKHTCVIIATNMYCWGAAWDGQLGEGGSVSMSFEPLRVEGDQRWTSVDNGAFYTCAIDDEAAVWCWGTNDFGQLGTSDMMQRSSPTRVEGISEPIVQVSAGHEHTCAVTQSRELLCWGNNFEGQLGIDPPDVFDPNPYPTPQRSSLRNVAQVRCGQGHTCAVQVTGEAFCWGRNSNSELGVPGLPEQRRFPTLVEMDRRYADVVAGQSHSAGLGIDGAIYGWGDGIHFQLGLGDQRRREAPTEILPGPFVQLVTDTFHGCALHDDGSLWCWGRSIEGQLGREDGPEEPLPIEVSPPAGREVVELAAGRFHTCLRLDDDSVYCTGMNENGQSGEPPPEHVYGLSQVSIP